MDESWVIAAKKGLAQDGPCELDLESGKRTPLYDKPWGSLSQTEQIKIINKFYSLPESKRAWEYSGSGPVVVDIDFYGWSRRLGVYADWDFGDRGWVVWVEDAREADMPIQLREAEEKLNELKQLVGLENLKKLLHRLEDQ